MRYLLFNHFDVMEPRNLHRNRPSSLNPKKRSTPYLHHALSPWISSMADNPQLNAVLDRELSVGLTQDASFTVLPSRRAVGYISSQIWPTPLTIPQCEACRSRKVS